jgi:hypothetical protein
LAKVGSERFRFIVFSYDRSPTPSGQVQPMGVDRTSVARNCWQRLMVGDTARKGPREPWVLTSRRLSPGVTQNLQDDSFRLTAS